MYKIQKRDLDILATVKEFRIVDSKIIAELFFPNAKQSINLANRRLKKLVELDKLNRSNRKTILEPYYYYIGQKPTNYKHCLMVANAYVDIYKQYSIIKQRKEFKMMYGNSSLIADLMIVCKDNNGKLKVFLIECENSKTYKDKYTNFINDNTWQNYFGIKPSIIVYSSRFKTYQSLIPIDFRYIGD